LSKQYLPYFAAILVLLLIFAPGIAGAGTKDRCTTQAGYENVTVSDAKKMLEKKDVFILDVRIPVEYNYGHIEGATLIPLRSAPKIDPVNLSDDQLLPNRMKELPHNKNTKILVYCKVGNRSPDACKMLVEAGYKTVYNMQGGIDEWVNATSPIVIVYDPTTWGKDYPHKA
jgi:rhodanese-related sulfurtransferase